MHCTTYVAGQITGGLFTTSTLPAAPTPIRNFEAVPGKHDVRFVFGPGDSQTLTVTVVAGREATVQLDYVPPAK